MIFKRAIIAYTIIRKKNKKYYLGQCDISGSLVLNDLNWFFRCLIFELFFFENADAVAIKDEALKKIREINGGHIKEQDIPLT